MNSVQQQCEHHHQKVLIESFHLNGHTFSFPWTVQDSGVFFAFGRRKGYVNWKPLNFCRYNKYSDKNNNKYSYKCITECQYSNIHVLSLNTGAAVDAVPHTCCTVLYNYYNAITLHAYLLIPKFSNPFVPICSQFRIYIAIWENSLGTKLKDFRTVFLQNNEVRVSSGI